MAFYLGHDEFPCKEYHDSRCIGEYTALQPCPSVPMELHAVCISCCMTPLFKAASRRECACRCRPGYVNIGTWNRPLIRLTRCAKVTRMVAINYCATSRRGVAPVCRVCAAAIKSYPGKRKENPTRTWLPVHNGIVLSPSLAQSV